jgi:2-dehydro-3-deoxygluconokinase
MVDVTSTVLPGLGDRTHADLSIHAGGSAVNAAAAAVRAGASATVVGRVGSDAAAVLVLAGLEELGVEAQLARDPELATGAAVALGDAVIAHRGANARLAPEDVPDELDADALFISGFALFQEGSAAAAGAALDRFTGRVVGIDVGSPGLAKEVQGFSAPKAVLFATAEEAEAMTGEEPEAAAALLADRFAIACIKLGMDGALAASADGLERRTVPAVERRAPFGAGDAFDAAFLVSLARELPIGTALEAACEAGARAAAG